MSYGKSIELFLVNGDASRLIIAELSNWNGKAIKIPRLDVKDCNREDFKQPGVYFLFCKEEDGTEAVYIGEAENIKDRLIQHIRDYSTNKEQYFWNTAVIFIGRDLNKAHIRYLEDRFVNIAKECNRYKLLTKNTYKNTVLKESQIASMEEFIENVKILISTLGYKVLVPIPKAKNKKDNLYCERKDAKAEGFISNNGFVVLKGSKIAMSITPSFKERSYNKLRTKLINDGIIKNYEFTQDYEFSSPSGAASVILGNASNGNIEWKDKNGKALKEL